MKKALIIVDMLNDFMLEGAPLRVEGAVKIIPNIKREIETARKDGYPVIYVCDAHKKDDPEFKIWPKHCVEGSYGAQVHTDLAPEKGDKIIYKTRYSGFFNTNLDNVLRNLGVDTLIITGVVTNICVLYTASDAASRDYRILVYKDCVMGLNEEEHEFALRQIKKILNGDVI